MNAPSTPAPPTDASGGVTGEEIAQIRALAQKAIDLHCDFGSFREEDESSHAHSEFEAACEPQIIIRICDAADRARKPGYRQVTLDDANALNIHLCNIAIDEWPNVVELLAALQHIGAVIPDAEK